MITAKEFLKQANITESCFPDDSTLGLMEDMMILYANVYYQQKLDDIDPLPTVCQICKDLGTVECEGCVLMNELP